MANGSREGWESRNEISGGSFQAPVFQGRDFYVTAPVAAHFALDQLPPPVPGFTGRDNDLKVMMALLDPVGESEAVVVSAVAGLAGVGKTSLAIHAGHTTRERGWFASGVL